MKIYAIRDIQLDAVLSVFVANNDVLAKRSLSSDIVKTHYKDYPSDIQCFCVGEIDDLCNVSVHGSPVLVCTGVDLVSIDQEKNV